MALGRRPCCRHSTASRSSQLLGFYKLAPSQSCLGPTPRHKRPGAIARCWPWRLVARWKACTAFRWVRAERPGPRPRVPAWDKSAAALRASPSVTTEVFPSQELRAELTEGVASFYPEIAGHLRRAVAGHLQRAGFRQRWRAGLRQRPESLAPSSAHPSPARSPRLLVSLSPCLRVSPSPCLLLFLLPSSVASHTAWPPGCTPPHPPVPGRCIGTRSAGGVRRNRLANERP